MSPEAARSAPLTCAAEPTSCEPEPEPVACVEPETPNSVLASQLTCEEPAADAAAPAMSGPLSGLGTTLDNILDDLLDRRPDEELLDAKEDLEAFRNTPFPGKKNYAPSSGLGQFDVACDMKAGTMTVTLKVGFTFTDGVASKVSPGFAAQEFKWKPEETATWKARFKEDIGKQWSSKFVIKSTRKHWEAMNVATTVRVVEDAAAPHFKVSVAKYPPDAGMVQSSVCGPGTHLSAIDGRCHANLDPKDVSGTGDFDSNDLRPEQKLDWKNFTQSILFDEGSATLTPEGAEAVFLAGASLGSSDHVEIEGHSNKKHAAGVTAADGATASMDFARERTAAVRTALIAAGASADQILVRNVGEESADEGAGWNRVDLTIGTHQTQTPAIHESGHMIQGPDEYIPPDKTTGGDAMPAAYDAMLKKQTGDTVLTGANESAMSMGSRVQRWNYAAFIEALKAMTGNDDWSL